MDAAVANRDPFPAQPAGLLVPAMRGQLAVRADYAPPGQTHSSRQHVTHGARRPRIAGAARDLPVADNLALAQIPYDGSDRVEERSSHSGARRTGLFPCDQDRVRAKH
jgi:hypothetical protein